LFQFSWGTQDGQCGACLLHAVDHNKRQIYLARDKKKTTKKNKQLQTTWLKG